MRATNTRLTRSDLCTSANSKSHPLVPNGICNAHCFFPCLSILSNVSKPMCGMHLSFYIKISTHTHGLLGGGEGRGGGGGGGGLARLQDIHMVFRSLFKSVQRRSNKYAYCNRSLSSAYSPASRRAEGELSELEQIEPLSTLSFPPTKDELQHMVDIPVDRLPKTYKRG